MPAFGDESGHLRNLLTGECPRYSLAVVVSDIHTCRGPAKRLVKRVSNLTEAKWNELNALQKRRFWDNLCGRDVQVAYLSVDRDRLHSMDPDHLLYRDGLGGFDTDMFTVGVFYAALVNELRLGEQRMGPLTFDRQIGKRQCDEAASVLKTRAEGVQVAHADSRTEKGIQTADCVAGAVSEHHDEGEAWLGDTGSVSVVDGTDYAMASLEKELAVLEAVP